MANKKLNPVPKQMYDTHLEKYKDRYNVIKRKEGYTLEKKIILNLIRGIEDLLTHDNNVLVNKNGFCVN
jgi:hypothetical protein